MRVLVFKRPEDVLAIRDLLYGPPELQLRGLAKCRAYQTRGPLPPSVHLTCQLLAAIHADLPEIDLYAIRLTYSMALIRFVNEILDSAQQGKSVIPLYALAAEADLPASFVELRHAATHEDLPSVYLLRDMANRAVAWLWTNYWSLQTGPSKSTNVSIKDLLREWRRIKRSEAKAWPSRTLGDALRAHWNKNESEFLDVLMTQNVLIPAGTASVSGTAVVALYLPVFELLGSRFCQKLAARITNALSGREWPANQADPREKRQFPLLQAWAEALAPYVDTQLCMTPRPWNASVLARAAVARGDEQLYDMAKEMAELTDTEVVPFQTGWKKVNNWTPRPLGE